MTVRGLLKQRIKDLAKIGKEAYKEDDKPKFADAQIRISELEFILKSLRK